MADTVQFRLERMVDELDDLERRGLFTRPELAEVVKQRRKFEYRLKRRSPLKEDYLAYIEYETQFEALRRLRKKSMARELRKKGNKKMKKSISDFSGVSRMIRIYHLAVMRYKGDVDLWFRYMEFCGKNNHGKMKKVLAQAIRFHPKVPNVWIYAAAWEFDHNLNDRTARILMQNGLRICPNSEDLWVEYLRMELTYLNKLMARKVALGEETRTLVCDPQETETKQWKDENKDLFMPIDNNVGSDAGSDISTEDSEKKTDVLQEQAFDTIRAIYDGAIEALPSSFNLRKQFFNILEATNSVYFKDISAHILCDMKVEFSKEPQLWDWLAHCEMKNSTSMHGTSDDILHVQVERAIQVYEEALQIMPSPILFRLYMKFLKGVVISMERDSEKSLQPGEAEEHTERLLAVYEKAMSLGCFTEDLACEYIEFYLELGRFDCARELAEKLCNGEFSNSIKLWIVRVSSEINCAINNVSALKSADLLYIFNLLTTVFKKALISEAEGLWLMALEFFATEKQYFDKLVELSFILVAKEGGSDHGFSLPSTIIDFVLQKDGIKHARQLYKRFLTLPHPGLALYRRCVELERNLASAGDKECLANTQKLYETALATYNQEVSLWRDYYALEMKFGTSESSNAIYWRAKKMLKNFSVFDVDADLV